MSKIPVVEPFNIAKYAKRNNLQMTRSISLNDNSKLYILTKQNRVDCIQLNKENQIVGAKCAAGSTQNLIDTVAGIIEKIKDRIAL